MQARRTESATVLGITHHQHRRYLMEARVVNNLPPAAAHDGAVRCLLAIELSKKSWVVAVNTPLWDKISIYKLKPCDWKELLQLIERIRKRVEQELKKPVEVISCYEAGYDGFWLHRLLQAQGVRNHVIDPASLQVDRRARRAKSDGIDVEKLLRSLMAYLRGDGASSVYRLSLKRTIVGFTANVAG
jgi:transposase